MIEKNWKELIKPSKLSVQHDSNDEFKATIVAEPIERGFGVTIGNALRRILLSSLQGSSITSIQIQGVLHEFSSLPGVRFSESSIGLKYYKYDYRWARILD